MKALKKGNQRVYFPEFPNHPLNGASFERNGAFTGELNGLKKRKVLTRFMSMNKGRKEIQGL